MRRILLGLSALSLVAAGAGPLHAQAVRSGFQGNAMGLGEDVFAGSPFGFSINYFGVTSSLGVVCTNGYIILGGLTPVTPGCAYPDDLSVQSAPDLGQLRTFYGSIMAPYFSDMYTADPLSGDPTGTLWMGTGQIGGWNAWGATWNAVGGWWGPTTTSSVTFQTILIDQGGGDFIMEFNYGRLDWEAEGGIGITDDGGATGTPVWLDLDTQYAVNGARLSCLFTNGTPNCAYVGVVPEPSTIVLVATAMLGLLLLAAFRRRRAAVVAATTAAAMGLGACSEPPAAPEAPLPDARRVVAPAPTAPPLQYVVMYRDGSTDLASPSSASGTTRLGRLSYLNGAVYANVADPEALRSDPNVASVVENFISYPTADYPTGALYWTRNWQWGMQQIGADQVPTSVQGQGVKACIIDTGVDGSHQDLAGHVVAYESFVTPSRGYPGPGPSAAPLDSNGHGSHVAGTITSNGIGVAPVAPQAQIMAAKVFAATGGASLAALWDAMAWCTQNDADVINMSLGGTRAKPTPGSADDAIFQEWRAEYASLVEDARDNGAVVVVAAGNDALNLDPSASFEVWPAQIPGVITVGATAPMTYNSFPFAESAPSSIFDQRANYSSYGVDVDIYAPGGTNYVNRVQSNIISVCSSSRAGCETGQQYMAISGTSMATPHVVGVAALITSRLGMPRGLARAQTVEQCLQATGDPITIVGLTRPRLNALRAATESCGGAAQ